MRENWSTDAETRTADERFDSEFDEDESLDITEDPVVEELAEAFVESAVSGADRQERRKPSGGELEPEENAIHTRVDTTLLVPDDPPPDS